MSLPQLTPRRHQRFLPAPPLPLLPLPPTVREHRLKTSLQLIVLLQNILENIWEQ